MSTEKTTPSESKARAAEFAKNYPFRDKDGYFGPVTIGNVGEFGDRDIVNLCLRTEKSAPNNASISYPKIWNKAKNFSAGMQVNVLMENGFIKKITEARPESVGKKTVSAATVNKQVGEQVDQEKAADAVTEALKDVPAASLAVAGDVEDKPF